MEHQKGLQQAGNSRGIPPNTFLLFHNRGGETERVQNATQAATTALIRDPLERPAPLLIQGERHHSGGWMSLHVGNGKPRGEQMEANVNCSFTFATLSAAVDFLSPAP